MVRGICLSQTIASWQAVRSEKFCYHQKTEAVKCYSERRLTLASRWGCAVVHNHLCAWLSTSALLLLSPPSSPAWQTSWTETPQPLSDPARSSASGEPPPSLADSTGLRQPSRCENHVGGSWTWTIFLENSFSPNNCVMYPFTLQPEAGDVRHIALIPVAWACGKCSH